MNAIRIAPFSADDLEHHLSELGALLHACVHDGASVGFVTPFETTAADEFWRASVLAPLRAGELTLLVARAGASIAGTVQLAKATMPNQRHRADVRKLLVHPRYRRRGIARALMFDLLAHARHAEHTLLTLDTRTGDDAEPLYRALGFQTAGTIPGYARAPHDNSRFDATTLMYKTL